MAHLPVMLSEVLGALQPRDGETYVDATFGGGGYARAVLGAAECELYGIDRDIDAIARAEGMTSELPGLTPLLGRFGDMDVLLRGAGVDAVNGVMLDIGVSSFQIDQGERGFSFMRDGPLDMRMGQSGASAADVVNQLPESDLAQVIRQLGEEKQARRIAKAIAKRRTLQPFETTMDLASVIEEAVGGRKGRRTHPATLSFQAIRMYVNDELGELARGLAAAERLLVADGRLVVVTFHSLEDRLVKYFLRDRSGSGGGGSRYRPEKLDGPAASFDWPQHKPVEASDAETSANPRARSARLRVGIRSSAPAWTAPVETGVRLPPLTTLEAAA